MPTRSPCRLAGVSTAAPYRHFEDRQAILEAVADDGAERLAGAMAAAAGEHAFGSYDAIAAMGSAYVGFARDERQIFRLMFGQHQPAADPATDDCDERDAYTILLEHVAAHLERDIDDAAVLQAALSLWMMVHGLAFLLIDEQIGRAGVALDIAAMIEANGRQLLAPFHRDGGPAR